tara:strand:+ start:4193 stop:4906 length:714 start_codon:yes stop_codon:yes gene_type:complete
MSHHQEEKLPVKSKSTLNPRPEEEEPKSDSSNPPQQDPPNDEAPVKDDCSGIEGNEATVPVDEPPKHSPTDNSSSPDNATDENDDSVEEEELHPSQAVEDLAKQHFQSEQAPDLTADPVSEECELVPRLLFVKVTKRFEKGACEFSFEGEKVILARKLSELLEALLLDDGPSHDEFVRFKSITELMMKLRISRSSLHNAVGRLREVLSEHLFLLGDPIESDRNLGYRISLLNRQLLG